jgi:xanthine dehydrogenase accessory factor
MGSRRTHVERLERLRTAGLTDTELSGLSSPVGLDLRARRPEETAVSIAAEIIAARSGGSGARLRDLDQPSHQRAGQAISLSTCLL